MNTTKDLFDEFLELYYIQDNTQVLKLKDILISPGVVLRILDKTYIIYYLTSGMQIIIPWKFVDLFSALNTWGGDRILISTQKDDIDKLIFHFLNLIRGVETKNEDLFMTSITNILEINTKNFIKVYDKLNLERIEIRTLNKIIEI
jgi:hypothetical protein